MSELEQTIEELEAEVLAELEEASDPKSGAAPAAKAEKADDVTPDGKTVELNKGGVPLAKVEKDAVKASNDPEDEIGKKAAAAAKVASGDAQQKGAGKADTPQKLAAGFEPEGEVVVEAKKQTKAQALEQIAKMKKSEIDEMIAAHTSKLAEAETAETEEELEKLNAAKDEIEEKIKSISVKEDIAALVDGESLSEEFKNKAAIIFEAAVKSKTREEITRIHEVVLEEKEEEIETFKSELTEKVDTYLNYVVEEWTKENELAIERGLKGEIAEDFISGLKQLFEDHYIDVPNEKYDVLEAQSEKISELEEKVNSVMEQNIVLSTAKSGLVRERVISEVSEDLADTEIEKFKSLTEDVDFTDEDSFREKCETLKDSYFPKTVVEQRVHDEDGSTAQDVDTTDAMTAYLSAISRNQKASA